MSTNRPAILRVLFISAIAALLMGCASPERAYIDADRKTFNAIAQEYLEAVIADPDVELLDKQLAAATIIFWDERLRAEEERLEIPSPEPYPPKQLIEELSNPPTE